MSHHPDKVEFTPDQIKEIETLSAVRIPMDHIAQYFGITKKTLESIVKRDEAVRFALEQGRAKAKILAHKLLYIRATDEKNYDFQSLKFWLQTQEGFSVTEKHELSGNIEATSRLDRLIQDPEAAELAHKLALKLTQPNEPE